MLNIDGIRARKWLEGCLFAFFWVFDVNLKSPKNIQSGKLEMNSLLSKNEEDSFPGVDLVSLRGSHGMSFCFS